MKKDLLNAANSIQAGQVTKALELLEELSVEHSDNLEVVKLTAIANQRMSNYADAAFYFDIAATMDYGDPRLFKYAGENFVQANDFYSARSSYFNYLKSFSDDAEVWLKFADVLSQREEHKKSLDAYLKGLELLNVPPTSDHQSKLGQLFLNVNNYAQAEYRFREALKDQSGYSLPALLGLLEVQKATRSWKEAKATVRRLENEYPGTLDTTPLASIKNEIHRWESAQEKVIEIAEKKTEIVVEDVVKPLQIPSVFNREPDSAAVESQLVDHAEPNNSAEQSVDSEPETAAEIVGIVSGAPKEPSDAQAVTETLSNTVIATPENNEASQEFDQLAENSTVAPKEEGQTPKKTAAQVIETKKNHENQVSQNTVTVSEKPVESLSVEATPEEPVLSLQEKQELQYLERGTELIINKNYASAVSILWKALGLNSQNAKTWYSLSRAYLLAGEMENAEMTIMEAVRNDEENLNYRIEYLKLMKKLQPAEKYLNELLKSKEDFPDDPTITLSLASAFSTIRKKPRVSILLYQEFLEKHPEHPLADRVKSRLKKLTAGT